MGRAMFLVPPLPITLCGYAVCILFWLTFVQENTLLLFLQRSGPPWLKHGPQFHSRTVHSFSEWHLCCLWGACLGQGFKLFSYPVVALQLCSRNSCCVQFVQSIAPRQQCLSAAFDSCLRLLICFVPFASSACIRVLPSEDHHAFAPCLFECASYSFCTHAHTFFVSFSFAVLPNTNTMLTALL